MPTEPNKELETVLAQRSQEVGAELAAIAIAHMDPHAQEDLLCYIKDLREAQQRKDAAAIRYIVDAIRELLVHPTYEQIHSAGRLDDIEREADPRWPVVKERGEEKLASFFERYLHFKDATGLRTQQDVAKAANISLSTVQAIEGRKTRPQYKTVQALARAFGTTVNKLAGDLYREE